ncbi:MAG: hypothetical protein LBS63_04285, partial [Prevotellaceae bacterium]|nr:hypothetical protein [Prevotellaceae bacterium]
MNKHFTSIAAAALLACGCGQQDRQGAMSAIIGAGAVAETLDSLSRKYPEADTLLMRRGVELTARFWLEQDGTADEFRAFCLASYLPHQRGELQQRFADNLAAVNGGFGRMSTQLQFAMHVERGDLLPVDATFAEWTPSAHLSDDWFANKLALTLHLNFPYYGLEERNAQGMGWSAEAQAAANLGQCFASRAPEEVHRKAATAEVRAEMYAMDYNIFMHHIVDAEGNRYFPEAMRLISHWGLRDELKSSYADKTEQGRTKQQLIYDLMLRIIAQDIPQEFINAQGSDYCPASNTLYRGGAPAATFAREPDTRYARLLDVFNAQRAADPYSPLYPNAITRAFDAGLEMTFGEVEALFKELLSSPVNKEVAALIGKRLGRPLQPYDIWYDGFKARSAISEDELTAATVKRFPNAAALNRQLPDLLQKLGFARARAEELCSHIAVDAARGSGHAMGATMKGDTSRLRARIPAAGLDYKGFNIAVHEFGHNVEQTIS